MPAVLRLGPAAPPLFYPLLHSKIASVSPVFFFLAGAAQRGPLVLFAEALRGVAWGVRLAEEGAQFFFFRFINNIASDIPALGTHFA